MGQRILPVGTIVRVRTRQLMIAGYTWGASADKKILKYVALPYPQGMTEKGGIITLSEEVFEVIAMGFCNEAHEMLAGFYGAIRDVAKDISATEMDSYLQEAAKINRERSSK